MTYYKNNDGPEPEPEPEPPEHDYVLAELVPDHVLENIFSRVDVPDLLACALTCRTWELVLRNENNPVWRTHCKRKMPLRLWQSNILKNVPTFKSKLRAHYHAWNPKDCSRHIGIKKNGFTFVRLPFVQSTDGVRGKIGYDYGRHAWEVIWEGQLGTSAVIGVSTKDALLHFPEYVALLGSDEEGWGWNVVSDQLLHGAKVVRDYPGGHPVPRVEVGDRVRIILDCEEHTLAFEKNHMFMGLAFTGLPKKKMYPTVSTVYGNTEVTMVYLGQPLDG
ncbi:F-box/SPRY domain-containing protein 1-like [Pectinophora gossypiella]|uniref:F-box/SPRY domain-containing protein 1-like n=1 Tax=Pectinophora gossypiella TaxID=13191 RepID=UPI00214EA1D0|nr:F-box/SPRY domain-containing protein 1-like [Pectinophora gossypiella]